MEYKFYNSNTLKSVQLNEDTNVIFELNKANCNKVFLNTLLYSSQYGCPISFSLIRNLNSTANIGFGVGAVLDFMYELTSVSSTSIKLKHPTGDIEEFINSYKKTIATGKEVIYYVSSTTSNFIKKIVNGSITNLTYYNGSLVAEFEYKGITPLALSKFTRNGNTTKGWVSVTYGTNGKLQYLFNEAEEQEFVEFTYTSNYTQFVVSKKIDKTTKTEIKKVVFTYSNNSLILIKETMHGKTTPIRHTSFTKTTGAMVVKNEISTLYSTLNYSANGVSSINMQDDAMTVTYVNDHLTNISVNGMWEKYFFDFNNNLQHIENSVGEFKTFQYDNSERRLLLLSSDNLSLKMENNSNEFLDNTDIEIISPNSYAFNNTTDNSCPSGSNVIRVNTSQIEEDQDSIFTFRFNKKGRKFDVENVLLWYKINSFPSATSDTDLSAHIYFYKATSSSSDILIRNERVFLNSKIDNLWFCNILSAQVGEEYDYIDVVISNNDFDYQIDFNVQLISDSFAKIYKYDSYGRVIKVLTGKQIQKYKYNEDNLLVSSSKTFASYDEYGKTTILINSNNIQQEITRDNYSNETSKKAYNYDKTKYIQSSKTYIDNEHLTSENDENNDTFTYLYDDKKRLLSSIFQGLKSTISYSTTDDVNYGKVNTIMHNFNNSNIDGSKTTYKEKGTINSVQHLNLASTPDYTYSYTYDTQNRLTKISIGSATIVEYAYSFSNNRKTVTMKLNGENIVYNYDENERLISKSNDSGVLYEYTYDDNTTRIKSIKNVSNNETISFEYDGILLSKVLIGTFKTVYTYNNNKNILLEKKYNNENLISIEKITDSSLSLRKDSVMTFENTVFQNEGDNVYLTTFAKQVYKDKILDTIYEKDVTKDLKGKLYNQTIEHALINPVNNNYCYDGFPCISFASGDTPLLYQFSGEQSFTNKYSVFFGYKLDSLSTSIPIMQIDNSGSLALDRILLNVGSNYLKINLYNSSTGLTTQKTFTVSNTTGRMNFIAVNVSYTKSSATSYVYTVEVFYNGVSVGKIENVTLGNLMNELYLMGNSGSSVNVGKITSVFVKTSDHITSTNIAQYSSMLIDIYNNSKLNTHAFNKKLRLFNTSLPVICFDNTFDSINGSIKPYKLSFGKNILSNLDSFCPDSETRENVLVLKNQTLAYDFNLSTSGIAGVRFKRINSVETNIFSLNDSNLYIHVHNSASGGITVTVNSNTYYPTSLDTSWNNIFVKWEKVVSSGSIDEYVYNVYLYVNGTSYSLGEHTLTANVSKMIMSVGKCYLNSADNPGCFGYVEKAIGCSTSTSISSLNSLFNNFGEGVLNEYDEFNQKTKKHIYTKNSNKITHSYTYDVSDAGRVMGKLTNEIVSLAQNNTLTYYYFYNLDKTISKQRIHNTSTNSYIDKTFTYDNKKQLTQYSDGTNTYVYTYDNMGNITKITKNGTSIHTATFTNGILLNTVNGYTINYDSSGVYPLSKYSGSNPIEEYTWKDGKLIEFKYSQQNRRICFEYAANGLRTSKKEYNGSSLTNTTKYYYNANGLLVYETRTSNNVRLEYLYDAEGSLYGVYYNGTPYYYIKDVLGNIMYLVDSSKNIVTRFDYDGAYGKHSVVDVNSAGSTHITFINPFRYKGYYYDVETQLFYCNSRYYSPELCRFISPDSIEYLDPKSINGLNLYAYCGNDPINKYDPTGHFTISTLVWIIVGAAVLTTAGAITYGAVTDSFGFFGFCRDWSWCGWKIRNVDSLRF